MRKFLCASLLTMGLSSSVFANSVTISVIGTAGVTGNGITPTPLKLPDANGNTTSTQNLSPGTIISATFSGNCNSCSCSITTSSSTSSIMFSIKKMPINPGGWTYVCKATRNS